MYSRSNAKGFKRLLISFAIYAVIIAGIGGGGWLLDKRYNFFTENTEYDALIERVALKHNVDPLLVKAVIWRESRFRSHSRGSAGEVGLMQIMPKSATKTSVVEDWERANGTQIRSEGNLFYPEINIEIGTWYLARAIGHWTGYKDKNMISLCEYNAGKRPVNEWIKGMSKEERFRDRIEYSSTRDYVAAIMVKYNYYKTKENEKH